MSIRRRRRCGRREGWPVRNDQNHIDLSFFCGDASAWSPALRFELIEVHSLPTTSILHLGSSALCDSTAIQCDLEGAADRS